MTEQILLDNDVVLKIACYSLVDEMLATTTSAGAAPGMLGVGRFVVRGRLERDRRIADPSRAKAAFDRLLLQADLLEPSEDELAMAAELEAEAARLDLELDGGESQLVAMLTSRGCRLLVTGDKRAIAAMAAVARSLVAGRVACLEQVIAQLVASFGSAPVRSAICAESMADRAVTLCFSCGRDADPGDAEVLAALASYSGHLNRAAPGILLPGSDLSAAAR